MRYTDPALLDALAAQYVLGTLRGRARQRFERLLRDRVDIRSRVYAWEQRLQDLDAPAPGEAPPARVWEGLEERLGFTRQPAAPLRRPGHLVQAMAASVAALVMAGGAWFIAQQTSPGTVQVRELTPTYVSVVTDGAGADLWLVQVYDELAQVRVRVTGAPPTLTERAYELWMLPKDGNPVSLGLLPTSGTLRAALSGAALDALASSANLAVSTEPAGGSPTGQPTGDVVFIAPLASG